MNVSVILIVHNQMDIAKELIKMLNLLIDINMENIVIVDNHSKDGLREYLEKEKNINYLICDEKIENYSVILNTAIREFGLENDILVLMSDYIPLPGALQEMHRVLHLDKRTGAVSIKQILSGSEQQMDYNDALKYVTNQSDKEKNEEVQCLSLEAGAVMIKAELLREAGLFDEKLVLPFTGIMDFLFRGIEKGYHFYECGNAYFYRIADTSGGYPEEYKGDVDRSALKEKWDMNYFNIYPNMYLTSCIREETDKAIQVLEIGCDCGANLLEVKKHYPNARLYGVELNAAAAGIAGGLADVRRANIEDRDLDFNGEKFDYIMFGDVLEHLRDPAGTIRYCRTLLNSGGRIIACIPNLMHYSVMKELLRGNFTYSDNGLLDRTHIHFFTYKEILRMFKNEGYEIEMVQGRQSPAETAEEDQKLVSRLLEISEGAEEYMFLAYQYVITARKGETDAA